MLQTQFLDLAILLSAALTVAAALRMRAWRPVRIPARRQR